MIRAYLTCAFYLTDTVFLTLIHHQKIYVILRPHYIQHRRHLLHQIHCHSSIVCIEGGQNKQLTKLFQKFVLAFKTKITILLMKQAYHGVSSSFNGVYMFYAT
jgi:hypothetical protein